VTDPDDRDVRALLGTALHGEPPSALDPARLIRHGKRRLRLQRAGAALGVVVIAGGMALGTTFLRQHDTAPTDITSATTPSQSAPPSPSPSPSTLPRAPITTPFPPSAAQSPAIPASDVIAAQNAALKQAYSALVSGLYPVSGQLEFVAAKPSGLVGADYIGSDLITRLGDKRGTGDFDLSAEMTLGADPGTTMSCDAGKMLCAVQTVDGISVEVETDHPTAKTTRILTVAHSRSGNVLVNGTSDNLDSPKTRNPTRPSPPLTADQLARITAAIAKASP
jgi:hypothetical protein